MKFSNLTALSVATMGAVLMTGCEVRESYGYRRHGVVVRETVVAPIPPPPPPPPVVVAPAPPPVVYQSGPGEVIDTGAPPPPQVEVITVSPGPAYVWVPGAWSWNGRWVWTTGRWDRPPRRGAVWVPHHYAYRGGVHVWVRGGWR